MAFFSELFLQEFPNAICYYASSFDINRLPLMSNIPLSCPLNAGIRITWVPALGKGAVSTSQVKEAIVYVLVSTDKSAFMV